LNFTVQHDTSKKEVYENTIPNNETPVKEVFNTNMTHMKVFSLITYCYFYFIF